MTRPNGTPVPGTGGFERPDVCIASLDPGLRVLEANDDFLSRLDHTSPEVFGQHFGQFVHPSVKPLVLQHLDRLIEGRRRRCHTHFMGARTSTGRFTGELTGEAVRGNGGKVSSIVLLVRPHDVAALPGKQGADGRKLLSDLDARVLEGIAVGSSTVQMAGKLFLSRQGVEYHVGAMLRRFKCPNRSALVAKAYSQGVLCIGQWPPRVVTEFVR